MFAISLFKWAAVSHQPHATDNGRLSQFERYIESLSASRRVTLVLLSNQIRFNHRNTTSLQFQFRFVPPYTRLVTRNKQHLLDYPVTKYFTRGCLRFTRVGFKLENDGIFFLGDLVKISEDQFRSYTTSETIIRHVKQALHQIGLDFGMSTPQWKRPDPQSVSLG